MTQANLPTPLDPTTKLADLKIDPRIVTALSFCGYNRLADFEGMERWQILRLPGVGGMTYRRIMLGLGREPHPNRPKMPRGTRKSPPPIPEEG